jgi:hypothetical protein
MVNLGAGLQTIVNSILSREGPKLMQTSIVGAIQDSIKGAVEAEVSKYVQTYLDANPDGIADAVVEYIQKNLKAHPTAAQKK